MRAPAGDGAAVGAAGGGVRLLLDQNLSFKLCARLVDVFPGSMQARLVGLDRADDRTLWDHAAGSGFVLVTRGAPTSPRWPRSTGRPRRWSGCAVATPTGAVEATLRRGHELILAFVHDEDAACLELR